MITRALAARAAATALEDVITQDATCGLSRYSPCGESEGGGRSMSFDDARSGPEADHGRPGRWSAPPAAHPPSSLLGSAEEK